VELEKAGEEGDFPPKTESHSSALAIEVSSVAFPTEYVDPEKEEKL
jgi:hypothetical protein